MAQRVAPQARVVYVDNDPMVLRHAQAPLRGTPQGTTGYLQADLRDPAPILDRAAAVLDFRRPMAIMLIGVRHLVPDDDDPWRRPDPGAPVPEGGISAHGAVGRKPGP